MEVTRRGFLKGLAGILAASAAPAIITTPGLLMPVRKIITAERTLVHDGGGALRIVYTLHGDGVTDDTEAMQAWIDGKEVFGPDGAPMLRPMISGGTFRISNTLYIGRADQPVRSLVGSVFLGPVKDDKPLLSVHSPESVVAQCSMIA